MVHIQKYNAQGEKIGTLELSDAIFGVAPKAGLVHQVYIAQRANAREPWADTKKRGEVRGGGRKPWQQKGTGRARHGSIRSPIWKGGGVVFGPLSERTYKQKVNKGMAQRAVRMCLSDKATYGFFAVVEAFPDGGKTKAVSAMREKLPYAGASALVLLSGANDQSERAWRNLPRVSIRHAKDVSVVDLLNHALVIATEESVKELEKRLENV